MPVTLIASPILAYLLVLDGPYGYQFLLLRFLPRQCKSCSFSRFWFFMAAVCSPLLARRCVIDAVVVGRRPSLQLVDLDCRRGAAEVWRRPRERVGRSPHPAPDALNDLLQPRTAASSARIRDDAVHAVRNIMHECSGCEMLLYCIHYRLLPIAVSPL